MSILVDTSIWSLALRRRTKQLSDQQIHSVRVLRNLIAQGQVLLPGVIRQEILSGLKDQSQYDRLRNHLRDFDPLPSCIEDYEQAAGCYNMCAAHGIAGSDIDMLLCSLSLRVGAAIFTDDQDFVAYRRILGVQIVDAARVERILRNTKHLD